MLNIKRRQSLVTSMIAVLSSLGCAKDRHEETVDRISAAATSACSTFNVTTNAYDGPQWWGTITFKNNGPSSISNFKVEFDVPSSAHCTAEPDAVPTGATLAPLTASGSPRRTTGNHCIFTWASVSPVAPGASKTFNYSADTQNMTAASNVVVSDSACAGAACTAFSVTRNDYDGPEWWGTMTFKNNGPFGSTNYAVEFDVPAGKHCTAEADSVPAGAVLSPLTGSNPPRTVSNHCVFTWTNGPLLATGGSKTFNYSTDTQSMTAASNVTARDFVCADQPGPGNLALRLDSTGYQGTLTVGAMGPTVPGQVTTFNVRPATYDISSPDSIDTVNGGFLLGRVTVKADGTIVAADSVLGGRFTIDSQGAKLTPKVASVTLDFAGYGGAFALMGIGDLLGPRTTTALLVGRSYALRSLYALALDEDSDYLSPNVYGLRVAADGTKVSLDPGGTDRYFNAAQRTLTPKLAPVEIDFATYAGAFAWHGIGNVYGSTGAVKLLYGRRYALRSLNAFNQDGTDWLSPDVYDVRVRPDGSTVDLAASGAGRYFTVSKTKLDLSNLVQVEISIPFGLDTLCVRGTRCSRDGAPVLVDLLARRYDLVDLFGRSGRFNILGRGNCSPSILAIDETDVPVVCKPGPPPPPSANQKNITDVAVDPGNAQHEVEDFSWSPDGQVLAFSLKLTSGSAPSTQNIWSVSPSGLGNRSLTNFGGSERAIGPTFSLLGFGPPMNAEIAFVHEVSGDPMSSRLRVVNLQGTLRTVTPLGLNVSAPVTYAPNDDIAFAATSASSGASGVYRSLPTSGAMPTLLAEAVDPDKTNWSPDGTKIAFVAGEAGQRRMYVMNSNGSSLSPISPAGEDADGPSWSPTNDFLVFTCGLDLCRINPNGSGFERLVSGRGQVSDPTVSPDANQIAFSMEVADPANPSARIAQIYVCGINGLGLRAWTKGPRDENPQWSSNESEEFGGTADLLAYKCGNGSRTDLCVISTPSRIVCSASCTGCCFQGQCLSGKTDGACGPAGGTCEVCNLGTTCDANSRHCVPSAQCGPGTCNGCCGADGKCYLGARNEGCGLPGETCQVCGANQTCDSSSHRCVTKPTCATTCQGCCAADGSCRPGTGNDACGAAGAACQGCAAGAVCRSNQCVVPPVCTPANCNGCCDTQGICQLGGTNAACGPVGSMCARCQFGETCDATTRRCQGTPACGPGNCTGCCGSDGKCKPGTSDAACGRSNGAACEVCLGGTRCDGVSSHCAPIPSCNALNCPGGCCDAAGKCVSGRETSACGSGGLTCSACASGEVCNSSRKCAPQKFCSSTDCPGGCCDPATGICQRGVLSNACGTGGATCQDCGTQLKCDPTTRFCVPP